MHVKLKRKRNPGRLSFYVVESVRLYGRPRHRNVAYLGGINVSMLDGLRSENELKVLESVCALEAFWKRLADNTGELSSIEVWQIYEKVELSVPFVVKGLADKADSILQTLKSSCRDYSYQLKQHRASIAAIASEANSGWMVRDYAEIAGCGWQAAMRLG